LAQRIPSEITDLSDGLVAAGGGNGDAHALPGAVVLPRVIRA
jgi:hypothetical protein